MAYNIKVSLKEFDRITNVLAERWWLSQKFFLISFKKML